MRLISAFVTLCLVVSPLAAQHTVDIGSLSFVGGTTRDEVLSKLASAGAVAVPSAEVDLATPDGHQVRVSYVFLADGRSLRFEHGELAAASTVLATGSTQEIVTFIRQMVSKLSELTKECNASKTAGSFSASEDMLLFSCPGDAYISLRVLPEAGVVKLEETRSLVQTARRLEKPPSPRPSSTGLTLSIGARLFVDGYGCLGTLYVSEVSMHWEDDGDCFDARSFRASTNDLNRILYMDNGLGRWILLQLNGVEGIAANIGLKPGDGRKLMNFIATNFPGVAQSCWFYGGERQTPIDCSVW